MIDDLRCKWSGIDNARRREFVALHVGRPWHLTDLHSYSGDVRFFGVKAPCRKGRITKDFEKLSKESKSGFKAFCFTMIGATSGEVMAAVTRRCLRVFPISRLADADLAHPTIAEGLGLLFSNVAPRALPEAFQKWRNLCSDP